MNTENPEEVVDVDPTRCALCGGDNACAMANPGASQETSGEACWCMSVAFPENLREKIPAALRDRVCVCRACIAEVQNSTFKVQHAILPEGSDVPTGTTHVER